jgi:hypothetical protein
MQVWETLMRGACGRIVIERMPAEVGGAVVVMLLGPDEWMTIGVGALVGW